MRISASILAGLFLVGCASLFPKGFFHRDPHLLSVGTLAPSFAFEDPLDPDLARTGFAGRRTAIVFLRSLETVECRNYLESLKSLRSALGEEAVDLLIITSDPAETVEVYLAHRRSDWPVLPDSKRQVIRSFGVHDRVNRVALPAIFLLDREGRILWRHAGTSTGERVHPGAIHRWARDRTLPEKP